ncbi:MAG TPA: FAD binding domain-containing protein [Thermoanaerobaculia bacterium]|nr:FAD binding domain-containing protein [Thermoanaerobaculia bacterium]
MRDHLRFWLNGRRVEIRGERAFTTLSRFLRDDARATGTKIVCEEGDCGACTVLIGRPEDGRIVYRPVNSCIQFLFQVDSTHVVSVEGLGSAAAPNAVQEAMIRCHGAQCGYCTPGFIVAMCGLFDSAPGEVTERELRDALTGNLCRCTGYEPILKAGLEVDRAAWRRIDELYPPAPIAADLEKHRGIPVRISASGRELALPVDLAEATRFKSEHPAAVVVQGGTDFGVWCTKRGFLADGILGLGALRGLDRIGLDDGTLSVGGRVSLTAFEEFIRDLLPELWRMMQLFGSPQIRNAGTLAGNIANASPIADTLPFLYVAEASVELTGTGGSRMVPIGSFYRGYKKLDMAPDELITRVVIPLPKHDERLRLYKVTKRRHLDISSFTAGFRMEADGMIRSIRIAYGGVGPVVLRLKRTEDFLKGKPMALESFEAAGEIAKQEIAPISDVRGSADFRLQLAGNVLQKFYYDVSV